MKKDDFEIEYNEEELQDIETEESVDLRYTADLPANRKPAGKRNSHRKKENPKRRYRFRFLYILSLIVALIAAVFFYASHYTFMTYSVDLTEEASGSSERQFFSIGRDVVKITSDALSYYQGTNLLWSSSGDFSNPKLCYSESYFAVTDRTGYSAYICDKTGVLTTVKVSRPILCMSVSSSGVLAVCTESEDTAYILYFDRYGNRLSVEIKTVLDVAGYPVSIAISPDGQKLIAVYYSLANGIGESRIVIYDFENGVAAQSYIRETYEDYYDSDTFLSEAHFLSKDRAYVLGDNGITFLTGFFDRAIKRKEQSFSAPLRASLFTETGPLCIFEEEKGLSARHYDTYGNVKSSFDLSCDFEKVSSNGKYIAFLRGDTIYYYNIGGTMRYEGTLPYTPLSVTFSDSGSLFINKTDGFERITLK